MPEIIVEGLTAGYNAEIVIRNLSFNYRGPGIIQILGPNGAGKSTLIRAILGLIKPVTGKVVVNGEDVTGNPGKAGKYIGYVPQITTGLVGFYPMTLKELVLCCLMMKRRWPRIKPSRDEIERVEEVLKIVGLSEDVWNKSFWELSGGQRQRGFIARALVHDPEILVMDEPFSNVDPIGKIELARKIGEISKHKLIIVTSHDPMLLLPYTRAVLLVNREVYVYGKPEEVLTKEMASKIYGEALIEVRHHVHIIDSHA